MTTSLNQIESTGKHLLKTGAGLALHLNRYAEATESNIKDLNKAAAFKFLAKVIKAVPVDTGYLRYNFQIDHEPDSEVLNVSRGKDEVIPVPEIPDIKSSDMIWVYNNVEYLVWVEHGSSDQAPDGFLRIALEQVKAEIKAEIKALGMG
ncbi:HK97 gp10 family phage protein [Candidatus Pacearchaeota archaeon]|nr:HK97 gp10 family phage protein [Candidatus Pacearchaeota archaeon]